MIDFVDKTTHCEITFSTAAGTKINTQVCYGIGWGNTVDEVRDKVTTIEQASSAANTSMWYTLYKKPIPRIPVTKL